MEMDRRQIKEADVVGVLDAPEQVERVREGRMIFQSRVRCGEPRVLYLLRVFVDVDRDPAEVVTVYRASKIRKYWRAEG
jgi:hypothetical protein